MRWPLFAEWFRSADARRDRPRIRSDLESRSANSPTQIPAAVEVLVTIKAMAVNFVDSLVITGKYQFLPQRPFAPGKMPVGEDEWPRHRRDRIQNRRPRSDPGRTRRLRAKVSVDASQCFKLPEAMSFVEAAAMALVYDTSWFALRERARIQRGKACWSWARPGGWTCRRATRQGDGSEGPGRRIKPAKASAGLNAGCR